MGTIKKGILGGFSGKVGNVIGSSWRGLDVMRSLPKRGGSLPTELQLEQRAKFGLVMGFLAPIKGILEKAYGTSQGVKSRFNLATSYHIQQAVTGIMPNLAIDYPNVVFTKGELLGPWVANAAVNNPAEVDFSWQNNSGTGLSNDTDKAALLVYNPSKKLYVVLETEITRIDLAVTLQVPLLFSGDEVHCYLGFISADGKQSATSVYLGNLTIL